MSLSYYTTLRGEAGALFLFSALVSTAAGLVVALYSREGSPPRSAKLNLQGLSELLKASVKNALTARVRVVYLPLNYNASR